MTVTHVRTVAPVLSATVTSPVSVPHPGQVQTKSSTSYVPVFYSKILQQINVCIIITFVKNWRALLHYKNM